MITGRLAPLPASWMDVLWILDGSGMERWCIMPEKWNPVVSTVVDPTPAENWGVDLVNLRFCIAGVADSEDSAGDPATNDIQNNSLQEGAGKTARHVDELSRRCPTWNFHMSSFALSPYWVIEHGSRHSIWNILETHQPRHAKHSKQRQFSNLQGL